MQIFKENLRQDASASQVIRCISSSSEFENLALREEEIPELETLYADACPYEYPRHANIAIRSKLEDESEYFLNGYTGKVYILLQSYISRATVHDFALLSDMRYIEESATRLFGAVFEIALRQGWPELARNASELARAVERRLWPFEHPLTQMQIVQASVVDLIKNRNIPHDIQILRRLSNEQWTDLLGSPSHVQIMAEIVSEFPYLEVSGHLSALAEQLFRIQISCTPCWKWGSRTSNGRIYLVHLLTCKSWQK
jgi:replicative superfamily II helicase